MTTTARQTYTLVTRAAELEEVREALSDSELVGLDTETTGLNPRRDRLRLLTLAAQTPAGPRCWIVDCFAVDPTPLFPVLRGRRIVGHNLAFDLGFLGRLGFEPGPVGDTMLVSQLLHGPQGKGFHTLAGVALRELERVLPKELQRSDWSGPLSDAQLEYAALDAAVLPPLWEKLDAGLRAAGLGRAAAIEHACLPAVAWLQTAGVPFALDGWLQLADQAEREAEQLAQELEAFAPPLQQLALFDVGTRWEWDSPRRVLEAFAYQGVTLRETHDSALALCEHPLAALLRKYRAARKLAGTYGRAWQAFVEDGRVYPHWRQLSAASGRMSCSDPNMQQVPRGDAYRACVRAPAGRALITADYSQIELRIAAALTRDATLCAAYREGADVHTLTAQRLSGRDTITRADRQLAKAVNFGLLYGMGAERLQTYAAVNYGVSLTPDEAQRARATFFTTYRGIHAWHRRTAATADGETRTLAGRRHRVRADDFLLRLNLPVQGTGADGLKAALGLLWERRAEAPGAFPVLTVHDELVVECDGADVERAAAWLRGAMVDGMQEFIPDVPVEVELAAGPAWAKG